MYQFQCVCVHNAMCNFALYVEYGIDVFEFMCTTILIAYTA